LRLTLLLLLPATFALATPTQASAASPALGTVTSLSSAASPVGEVQPAVLTATVEGPGWPSGTVTFSDYELGPLASVALSQGQATASLPALPPGLHLISAEYSGDGTFAPSSARLTQRTGDAVSSRVELNVDHNPSRPGQAVTLTADLLSGAGFGTASGTVTVVDGTTQLGSLPVSLLVGPAAQGPVPDHLTLPVPSLAPGIHSLTAIYSGDGNLKGSTSTTWNQVVGERVATATTLASAANPFLGGQKAMLSAAVAPLTPASREPSGTLTFRDGGAVLGKADLASGAGTLAVSLVAAGSHDLTVAYSGDSDFQESTSAPLALQVLGMVAGPSATSTSLTAGPNPLSFGQPLTLRASVAPVFGSRVPGGSVYFVDESGAVLGGIGLDPAGQGVLATSALTAGPHRLTAVYAGADGFSHSSSNPLDLNVERAPTLLSAVPNAGQQAQGQAGTLAVAVNGQGASPAPSGSVTFLDQGAVLGTVAVGPDGRAYISADGLPPGPQRLMAVYNGDAEYASSTTAFTVVVAGPAATNTALRASQARVLPGRDLTFTATVSAGAAGEEAPGGSVTFKEGDTVLGVGEVDDRGVARLTMGALPPGDHVVEADFAGDASYAPSAAATSVEVLASRE
jgi:hypothetical protein